MTTDRGPVETHVRTEHPVEGVTVVGLVGEHDLATKDEIARVIERALRHGDAVAVDLSDTEFIDSSTLHVLVASSRRAAESGRGFALVIGGNEAIHQLFELTGLVSQFETAASVGDAIGALQTRADPSDSART
jgi:anti-anti-sigma factor